MKRKFKILILAISILTMLSAFVISANAEDFTPTNSSDTVIPVYLPSHFKTSEGTPASLPVYLDIGSFYVNSYMFYYDGHMSSDDIEQFEIFYTSYDSDGKEDYYYAYNFKILKSYFESKNIFDFSTFNTWRQNLDADDDFAKFIKYTVTEEIYNNMFNFDEAPEITEDDLTAKYTEGYSQGKIDGAIEYKSSEEYTNTINLAKSAGVDEFKTSDEYASALNSKYNEGHSVGTSSGITAYKSSSEYKTALSDKYDEGYDVGFSEGEKSFDFGPMIVGILVLASIAIGLIIYNQKRRKKYRR